jgi:hypothetical protein
MAWEVSLTLLALAIANGAVVASAHADRGRLFGHLMMGPFSGWLEASRTHTLQAAAWMLVCTGFATVLPLAVYVYLHHRAALVLGAACWFASGYGFCLALWI